MRVGFRPQRVACQNRLPPARNADASKLIRPRHSKSLAENLDDVREVITPADREFEATAEPYFDPRSLFLAFSHTCPDDSVR